MILFGKTVAVTDIVVITIVVVTAFCVQKKLK